MPRISTGPRYYPSKRAYFANLNGERIKLLDGPDTPENRRIAQDKYDQLSTQRKEEVAGDRAECWAILTAYLKHARTRVSPPPLAPATFRIQELAINSFVSMYGRVKVRDLRMNHFQDWLTTMKTKPRIDKLTGRKMTWGDATIRMNMSAIISAFKWAATEGELISVSPFQRRGQKTPWPEVNFLGKKVAISDDEHRALCAQADRRANKNFLVLLECLYHTGARPAEMYLVTASEWNPTIKAFEIDPTDPKNIGRLKCRRSLRRQGRKRVIRIPDQLLPKVAELIGQRPKGPLFRQERDKKPWTKEAIADRFKSLVRATNKNISGANVRLVVTLYSYRHAFVTRWLMGGGNAMTLCELLNTSLDMLRLHYSHLFERHEFLREEVNKLAKPRSTRKGRVTAGVLLRLRSKMTRRS